MTLEELQTALRPMLTSKLGDGEEGTKRIVNMLSDLNEFRDLPFEKDAFDAIVAYNPDTGELLSPEESEKYFK